MDTHAYTRKNIVYNSDISAGGNIHIGDVIYNIVEDFSHSILFLRLEPLENNKYAAQITLKSRHAHKKLAAGLSLFQDVVELTISPDLFEQVNNFQSLRRLDDINFRKFLDEETDSLRANDNQLSQLLFETFFKGDILTVCQDFVELLEKNKIEELLLAISVDDTQVVNLPFEMVIPKFFPEKLGQARQSLAVNHFGLVRTLEKDLGSFDMQGKVASAAPLKMLFVTALPENMGEQNKMLEIEDEQRRLIDAIGGFEATGGKPNLVIEFLDTASIAEISEAIQKHQHDILHISGHGSYRNDIKQGVLHLENDNGNHCEVTGATLGETLRQHQCVRLLILSACETAMAGNGVVEQLAKFGVPAIIAMRFSVTDIGAKIFTTALYAALIKGETLTHAIAYARESLWHSLEAERKRNPNLLHLAEWFTPVVYLNQYTESLLNPDLRYIQPKDFYPHSNFLQTKNTRLIGAGFIGRKRYLNQLRRSFAQGQHVCLHGLGGMGKTTLAEAFTHNYDNHSHEVIIFRNGNQIAEKYILDELFARLEADETANKNIVRQIKQHLESNADPQEKLQLLIDNYLKNRRTILVFDNFEDVQISEMGEQQHNIGSQSLATFMKHLCQNTPPNCHLLFTTRYKISDLVRHITHLAVDKMTYAEQYRLSNFSETLRKIPLSQRQDIFKRLDGHPRAYEFLETLLKTDKSLDWTKLVAQIGEVEAKVWENLLLDKLYQRLSSSEQQLLQICAIFISTTPVVALDYVLGKAELPPTKLEVGDLLGLCFFDTETQTFEIHRLTREWMVQNKIATESLKKWAFTAGEYFKEHTTVGEIELAKDYFEIAEAWQEFAETSFSLQGHYQLIGLYQRAYELNSAVLEKNIDNQTNADALNYTGMMLISVGDYDTALTFLEKALRISQQIGDRKVEGANLNNISQIYDAKGDYDIALSFLEKSLIITQQIGDRQGEGVTLNNISQIHKAKGDYDTALSFLEKSLTIRQQIGDRQGEGATLNNIGQIHRVKGDYDTALSFLEKSLSIMQQIGDRKGEGTTLNNLATTAHAKGDYGTALSFLEKSLTIRQQIGDRQGEGATLNNISQIYSAKGDYDTALNFLEKALNIRQQIGDRQGEGSTLNNISQIYDAKGDYDTALSCLEKSLSIRLQIGDIAGLAATANNMGAIYYNNKNDFEKAIIFFMQSYNILQKIGSPNVQYSERYLGAIFEEIGEQKFKEILSKLNQ